MRSIAFWLGTWKVMGLLFFENYLFHCYSANEKNKKYICCNEYIYIYICMYVCIRSEYILYNYMIYALVQWCNAGKSIRLLLIKNENYFKILICIVFLTNGIWVLNIILTIFNTIKILCFIAPIDYILFFILSASGLLLNIIETQKQKAYKLYIFYYQILIILLTRVKKQLYYFLPQLNKWRWLQPYIISIFIICNYIER